MLTTETHDDDIALKPAELTLNDIDNEVEDKGECTPNDAGAAAAVTVAAAVENGNRNEEGQLLQPQLKQPPENLATTTGSAAAISSTKAAELDSTTPDAAAHAAASWSETAVKADDAVAAATVDFVNTVAYTATATSVPANNDVAAAAKGEAPAPPAILHLPTLPAPAPATFQLGIPQAALLAPVLPSPKKKRKTQDEFTIHQKLEILQELEGPDPPRVPDLAAKHNTSRTSIYRWKNDRRRLIRLGTKENKGGYKRVAHKRKGYNEEFTAEEKLAVVRELKADDPPSVRSLAERVGANHRSIYRWRKDEERLVKLVEMEGKGGCKRVGGDPLLRVKEGLKLFHAVYYETHNDGSKIGVEDGEEVKPPKVRVDSSGNPLKGSDLEGEDEQLPQSLPQPLKQPPLTGTIIAKKALQIRDEMLVQHELNPFLSEEEVKGMREFTASSSWGRKIVIKMGWKDPKFCYNDAPAVDGAAATTPGGDDAGGGGGDGGTLTIDAVIDGRSSAPKDGTDTKSVKMAELKREINVLLRKLEKSESKGKKLQKENTRLKKQVVRLTKSCSSKAQCTDPHSNDAVNTDQRIDPNSSVAVNMDVFPVNTFIHAVNTGLAVGAETAMGDLGMQNDDDVNENMDVNPFSDEDVRIEV